ncbi:PREDICTED: uncharacterized protein LOC105569599 [Vollenhovia emeryi]|uniref:uncharacterized protein LOC105569599 n=1 Tax=Vollenhovia emeryi TaxID=411798 RepID=UPI0005F49F1A|nr:PREDICTED: uncharacterized protein LOC105569599 [Vollenhovia emeryi]
MQDSDEMCLTSDIDFGEEDKKETEENKEKKTDGYDEAELMLENMQYNTHSDRSFDTEYLHEFMEFEEENPEDNDLDTGIDIQYSPTEDELKLLDQVEELNVVDVIKGEGLKYIAGYASFRFRSEFPFLGTPTELLINPDNDWINYISKGKLINPCTELFETAKIMEKLFQDYHGSSICKEPWIFNTLASKIIELQDKNCLVIPKKVLLCLIRTRTYIRVRELNKKLKSDAYKRKKIKKISKITNTKK